MTEPKKDAWFPAKRYGFGWGFPNRWQGWLVMAIWLLLVVGGTFLIRPGIHAAACAIYDSVVTLALLVVIAAKGEKTSWRRGGGSDRDCGR